MNEWRPADGRLLFPLRIFAATGWDDCLFRDSAHLAARGPTVMPTVDLDRFAHSALIGAEYCTIAASSRHTGLLSLSPDFTQQPEEARELDRLHEMMVESRFLRQTPVLFLPPTGLGDDHH